MLDDGIATARHGGGVKLTWESGLGWSGGDVEMLLRKYGIRCWKRQYAHDMGTDEWGVVVGDAQAGWAEYILLSAGVPLTGPLVDEANRNVQPGDAPLPWGVSAKTTGLAGILVDAGLGGVQYTKEEKDARAARSAAPAPAPCPQPHGGTPYPAGCSAL